jgi:inosose dehydratase
VRIATAIVNWNNADVPEAFPWIPYGEAMDHFVEAGYDATEWGPSMPTDPDVLGEELRSRGLTLVGAFVGLALRDAELRDAEIERALGIARFLAANGGTRLIAADSGDERRRNEAGHVDPAGGLSDAHWRSLGDGLGELAVQLEPLGMELVFHNHVGTYVETGEETARLLDVTDPARVGWCLDTGHLAFGGGDALAMLERYGDRVRHVHLKDVDGGILARARAEQWSFAQALTSFIFPPLGEGIARIAEVVAALGARGYDEWYVIEQDTAPGDPTETARANRLFLERLLRVAA